MLIRRVHGPRGCRGWWVVAVLSLAVLGTFLAWSASPVRALRWPSPAEPHAASTPEPLSPSDFGISLNCTEGNPGWCLSDMVVGLTYSGNSSSAYFEYSVDGSAWQRYSAPFLVSGDGPHFFNVTLYEDGHLSMRMGAGLSIDSVAPQSTIGFDATPDANGWFNVSPVVSLAGFDSYSGLGGLQYRVDDGSWQAYSAPIALSDGVHPFDYRAFDMAGNVESFHMLVLRVDTTPPTLYGLSPAVSSTSTGQVAWHAIDSLSGIAGYWVSVDGGPSTSVGVRETVDFSLPDGPHVIQVRALDGAGNPTVLDMPLRVDTNPFSYTGPYMGMPTYIAIVVAAVGVRWAWARQKRRMGRS